MPTTLRNRPMTVIDILTALLRPQMGLRVQPIREGNFLNAGLAVSALFVPVVTFTLPVNMSGQLEGVTYGCGVLSDFDQVIWQLQIDGAAVPQFDFMQGPQSTFVFPTIFPGPYPVRAGATITVLARTLTVTLGQIAAALYGSFWPAQGPEQQVDLTGHVTAQL